jgi:uncharacterized protein
MNDLPPPSAPQPPEVPLPEVSPVSPPPVPEMPQADSSFTVETELTPANPDEANLATIAHLLPALLVFFAPVVFVVGPLALWLWQKDRSAYLRAQTTEVLNFSLTWMAAQLVTTLLTACFAPFFVSALSIAIVIYSIIGTMQTASRKNYRYPICFRLVQ